MGSVRRNSILKVTFCPLTSLGMTVERCHLSRAVEQLFIPNLLNNRSFLETMALAGTVPVFGSSAPSSFAGVYRACFPVLCDLLKSRVECPDFLEKLESAQLSLPQNIAEEVSSWDVISENDLWDGGSNELDHEDYVLVSQEDIMEGIACFVTTYLLSLDQTKSLGTTETLSTESRARLLDIALKGKGGENLYLPWKGCLNAISYINAYGPTQPEFRSLVLTLTPGLNGLIAFEPTVFSGHGPDEFDQFLYLASSPDLSFTIPTRPFDWQSTHTGCPSYRNLLPTGLNQLNGYRTSYCLPAILSIDAAFPDYPDLTPNQLQEALSKAFSVNKKKGKLRKAWDGSQVVYNVASWGATAIG
ncbi:hypothetical protein Acr_00g0088110 [Actinidia rufa]|uniref:Uncharacterized protein n=1 Tax=Actinidia rufa TaxID=165716 RepID=A0A7J0DXI1_9ERIC|nr:hypothetical protein Acr_00g0088110 [Actinidia rufa]